MSIDIIASPSEQGGVRQAEWARKLRALMERIQALQTLVRAEDDGDGERGMHREEDETVTLDRELVLQELLDLERMTGELLYEMQVTDGDLFLGEMPAGSLSEALAQLVDATAEKLSLSSRVAFSGSERPLSDYLTRLLYRIAREALARVSAHEGARRLRFSLEYQRREIIMTIEDDGIPGAEEQFWGREASEEASLLPFLSDDRGENRNTPTATGEITQRLRKIVENLGGSLLLNSGVEQGVQLHIHLPLRPREREEHPPIASVPVQSRETQEATEKVRVLIVDSQTVSRAGLRRLLESYPDLEIVGEAGDSVQAVSETAELLPQIVLLEAQLPDNQSLETLRQVRQLNGDIHVLLLAGQEDETLLYEALRAGAGGYILKSIAPDELAQAVRAVARGDIHLRPQLAARLLTRSGSAARGERALESLTSREREVLQLLARGLRNKEIAARLFVSERTVNFHLANIYAKLRVSGRTEALSKALEQGLLHFSILTRTEQE
jgi:DNA-binding NarL/FixJ family response regulator